MKLNPSSPLICGRSNRNALRIEVRGTEIESVDIDSNHDVIGAGVEILEFTLTRTGNAASERDVRVTIEQEEAWLEDGNLSRKVTFGAGATTTTLRLVPDDFSYEPATSGDLTATVESTDEVVGGSKTVQVVSRGVPPITVSLEMPEYNFREDAEDARIYALATLHPDYPRPPATTDVSFSTKSQTAKSPGDYPALSNQASLLSEDYEHQGTSYVLRLDIGFSILDDQLYEGTEWLHIAVERSPGLFLAVAFARPDGTTCSQNDCRGVRYTVNILDDEFLEFPERAEALLEDLEVNDGMNNVGLVPAFQNGMFDYAASVPNGVSTVTVTATAARTSTTTPPTVAPGSVAFVDKDGADVPGNKLDARSYQADLDLDVGANAIGVRVTAEDGAPTQVYRIGLTREAPVSAGVLVSNTSLTPTTGNTEVLAQRFTTGDSPGGTRSPRWRCCSGTRPTGPRWFVSSPTMDRNHRPTWCWPRSRTPARLQVPP